jgi:hypothetical protein
VEDGRGCPQGEKSLLTSGGAAAHGGVMTSLAVLPPVLRDIIEDNEGVLTLETALEHLSRAEIRWRVTSGRWQRPCQRVLVAWPGPLTGSQRQRVAAYWAGPGAALAGLTAARLAGLTGFDWDSGVVHVLRPAGRKPRRDWPPADVVVHWSRRLGPEDVSPNLVPRRVRPVRALVDAAEWMPSNRGAQAILAAGVQQNLARVDDLLREAGRSGTHRRREHLIRVTLQDIAGGSQALSELDFMRLVVRGYQLPVPDRQVPLYDTQGRKRYLDAAWKPARVAVEIDGAAHQEVLQYWDDMDRDNQLTLRGYTVLRFPSALVRRQPGYVAAQIRDALEAATRERPPGPLAGRITGGRVKA